MGGDLKNFAKLIGKHLCQSLFFNKVAGLRPEKREWILQNLEQHLFWKTAAKAPSAYITFDLESKD